MINKRNHGYLWHKSLWNKVFTDYFYAKDARGARDAKEGFYHEDRKSRKGIGGAKVVKIYLELYWEDSINGRTVLRDLRNNLLCIPGPEKFRNRCKNFKISVKLLPRGETIRVIMEAVLNENQIIDEAKKGDRGRMNHLIELIRPRLHECVYRLTLDYHETQDIVQESLVDMAKCLGKLEDSDKFWPWLRRIAFNKMNDSRRKEARLKELSQKGHSGTQVEQARGLSDLVSKELSEAVFKSMSELKPEHRRVLVLRCYEDMEYSQIAEEMERSEFGTRMLFRRATNALKNKLAGNGLKKIGLLSALVVFGKMTSSAQAATGSVMVTAGSLKVGTAANILGALTSTSGIVTTALIGITAVSTSFILPDNKAEQNVLDKNNTSTQVVSVLQSIPAKNNIAESWYSFPAGPQGPFMARFTERDPDSGQTIGLWLQNETGNYYYDRKSQTVYMRNQRFINNDLSAMRLPTDEPQLLESLNRIEGVRQDIGRFEKLNGSGLLFVKGVDESGQPYSQSGRHVNMNEEEYFRNPWPKDTGEVDLRDEIHKQGWTTFTINGQINGKSITGRGQILFVPAAFKNHFPWICMTIDGKEYYAERDNYPRGLARPWEGLHAIDTIRRDAAAGRLPFEMSHDEKKTTSTITISDNDIKITYTIDIEKDWIENVRFAGRVEGQINFVYSQNIDGGFSAQADNRTSSEPFESLTGLTELICNK